ncbi:RNA-binding motif protein, X-linked 2 [Orchesella cincta]|uniref:RNA-binding motif protein, X-linked 2 n=1 Tax=Orchesella cincta TaxID=48709 RepID=A0A1D2N2N9_ORCCI|nr:RNA-binding motif protein, X-linked 2 [Orchesella cincta]
MNPLTNVRNVTKLSDRELKYGDGKTSWHDEYKDSAWIFIGGLPFELSEGDIIAVFSQYGEIVNLNLIRDKGTGKSRGFGFLCYENQKSTILAVDNFNAIKILGRTLRVDHVKEYKVPKDNEKVDDLTRELWKEGCAPTSKFGGDPLKMDKDVLESEEDEPAPPLALPPSTSKSKDKPRGEKRKHSREHKKSKKAKKSEKKKKKKSKHHHKKRSKKDSSSGSSDSSSSGSD